MRLTCPACKAQYEVPDDVIPPEGRDVQCSNCDEMWFQDHPDAELKQESAPNATVETAPEEASPAPQKAGETPVSQESSEESEDDAQNAEEMGNTMPRRKLDPSVADVLREEAELEALARRREWSGTVESQPDLGLTTTPKPPVPPPQAEEPAPVQTNPATPASAVPSDKTETTEAPKAQGQAPLPDIEEINSTLRPNEKRPAQDPGQTAKAEEEEERKTRYGFTVTVLLAAAFVLLYAFAPQLAQSFPQGDPWLSTYVTTIDQGRVWLDGQVQNLLAWFNDTTASWGE
ncbi:MAG: zinc-ribbon domain-containing protein [Roseobacter sp.]